MSAAEQRQEGFQVQASGASGGGRVRAPGVSAAGSEPSSRYSEARAGRVLEGLAGARLELA